MSIPKVLSSTIPAAQKDGIDILFDVNVTFSSNIEGAINVIIDGAAPIHPDAVIQNPNNPREIGFLFTTDFTAGQIVTWAYDDQHPTEELKAVTGEEAENQTYSVLNQIQQQGINMIYDLSERRENTHEAKESSKSFGFEAVFTTDDLNKVTLGDGDVIALGVIPAESYVTNMVLLVEETFDTGTTCDIGFIGDYPHIVWNEIQAGIALDVDHTSNNLVLPSGGVSNGTGIWSGKDGLWIGVTIHGATTKGNATLLISYINFEGREVNKTLRVKQLDSL